MNVARLVSTGLDAFYALRLRALAADPDAFLRTHAEELARGPSHCARMLADEAGNAIFAGVMDGALVGMVGVYREQPEKWRHKATIWGVFVDAHVRGQGLGGRLMDAAIAHARDVFAVRQVYLSAEAEHHAAIHLYESRGFVAWGTEPRGTMDGGRAMDEVHMWLDLEQR